MRPFFPTATVCTICTAGAALCVSQGAFHLYHRNICGHRDQPLNPLSKWYFVGLFLSPPTDEGSAVPVGATPQQELPFPADQTILELEDVQ